VGVDESLRNRLRAAFAWRGTEGFADVSGWWADPEILREIGPALADLHRDARPTLIAGVEAVGFLLGPSWRRLLVSGSSKYARVWWRRTSATELLFELRRLITTNAT